MRTRDGHPFGEVLMMGSVWWFPLSHYVTAAFLLLTRYHLLFDAWRGYLIAGFSLVWIANFYMAIFGRLRLEIKSQRLEIEQEEQQFAGKIT